MAKKYFSVFNDGTNDIYVKDDEARKVMVGSGSTAASGLVPKPPTTAGNTKFLREDGTWEVPAGGTSYSAFTGADGTNAGSTGLVPAPAATDNTKFLKGDGSWAATLALGTSSSTAYRGDRGNTAYAEAYTFGRGVATATTVASLAVSSHTVIVTIANGQTAQSFSLASAPTAGRDIHIIVDNTGNTSDLTITIPHAPTASSGIKYVNTVDVASGSMSVAAGKIGEINVIYASSKAWIRYVGA